MEANGGDLPELTARGAATVAVRSTKPSGRRDCRPPTG